VTPLRAKLEQKPTVDPLGGYAEVEPDPPRGTFEIGLVMAGAVSAGAYTAGVMDFLIEALDCWEAAKRARAQVTSDSSQWDIPGHQVKLRVVSGASAGAMTGAIAAVALNYDFPHVGTDTAGSQNPFYRAWVEQLDISKLLQLRDLQDRNAPVVSLLDSTALQEILDSVLSYQARRAPERPYLRPDVRFIFTQGNLRGIPYRLSLEGDVDAGLGLIAHSDYQSFCLNFLAGEPWQRRADDIALGAPDPVGRDGRLNPTWQALGCAALASGAFPIGLAPRLIRRDTGDFEWRFVRVPGGGRTKPYMKLTPSWTRGNSRYRSMVVDGGALHNGPLELARIDLAGILGRNPREGKAANRATILVDAFADRAGTLDDPTRGQDPGILGVLGSLMSAWKDHARFNPVDLALAADKDTFSRFLIAPTRGTSRESHEFALACGALGGFSGFLCEAYRRHDFLLGRRNCQEFLRDRFCLPADNRPVFSALNPGLKRAPSPWLVAWNGASCLPIIPLLGSAKEPQPLPSWPAQAFDPQMLRGPEKVRLNAVLDRVLRTSVGLNGLSGGIARWIVRRHVCRTAVNKSIEIVTGQLRERGLV
jgi:hypothetical protein